MGKKVTASTLAKNIYSTRPRPGLSRPAYGIKNSKKALNTTGVVRAIEEEKINPHNTPFLMNEPKLDDYRRLMNWYMWGHQPYPAQGLISYNQYLDNTTIRKSMNTKEVKRRAAAKNKRTKGKVNFPDMSKRIANKMNFTSAEKTYYTPLSVNERRLIEVANNIVYANNAEEELMDPQYSFTYYGR